jgi:hypothetical protein
MFLDKHHGMGSLQLQLEASSQDGRSGLNILPKRALQGIIKSQMLVEILLRVARPTLGRSRYDSIEDLHPLQQDKMASERHVTSCRLMTIMGIINSKFCKLGMP